MLEMLSGKFSCNPFDKNIWNHAFFIRTTWGTPFIPKVKTKLAFLLGKKTEEFQDRINKKKNILGSSQDTKLQEDIEQENSDYHDIIQGDFFDSYRNLSYKNIMGNFWVSEFCSQVCLKSDI